MDQRESFRMAREATKLPARDTSEKRWTLIKPSRYTKTPASTKKITMSKTSDMSVGLPLKYVYGGVTYYGQISVVNTNSDIQIRGAALNASADLMALYVGRPEMVVQIDVFVPGVFNDTGGSVLDTVNHQAIRWGFPNGYFVWFAAKIYAKDSGGDPTVIAQKNGNSLQLVAITLDHDDIWLSISAPGANTSNYAMQRDDALDLYVSPGGGSAGDATDLSASLIFVLE